DPTSLPPVRSEASFKIRNIGRSPALHQSVAGQMEHQSATMPEVRVDHLAEKLGFVVRKPRSVRTVGDASPPKRPACGCSGQGRRLVWLARIIRQAVHHAWRGRGLQRRDLPACGGGAMMLLVLALILGATLWAVLLVASRNRQAAKAARRQERLTRDILK